MGVIPPFVQQILGVIVRASVVWVAAKFGAELSEDQTTQIVAQVAPIVAVLAWSIYQKYRGRQKLMTAQASRHSLTEAEVEDMVRDPNTSTPSVNTPKNEVPR